MKICHVITRLIVGGAQENTLLSCKELAQRGHEVTLIAGPETGPEGSLWDEVSKIDCQSIKLDSLRRAISPWQDWRARQQLIQIFRRTKPDILHSHSSKAGILARSAARSAGVPIIVHTIHGMSFNRTQPALVRAAYRFLERRVARYTTKLVTVADSMIEQSVRAGIARCEKFITIRSGMEVDRFSPNPVARQRVRQDWGMVEDDVVIGTVARLFKNKGYEQTLKAMPDAVQRNNKLRFVWVGDGNRRAYYERRLERLGLRDRVRFSGLIPPDHVPEWMNGFDVLLHASQWEGLPRSVVQGLLCEIPAISFDNDGAPEVVIQNQTGVLVPLGDTKALADAMVQLAGDVELRERLGHQGRELCLRPFDWRTMVEQLNSLYGQLCNTHPAN